MTTLDRGHYYSIHLFLRRYNRKGSPSCTTESLFFRSHPASCTCSSVMNHTRLLLRPIRETVFGKYDVLRPPKSKTISSNKSPNFIQPSPISLSVIRPDYVPVNFWTRTSERDALEYDESSRLEEGWPGEEGVGSLASGRGMIPLGSIEEQTVRYAARLASEVLRDAGRLIKASRRGLTSPRWQV